MMVESRWRAPTCGLLSVPRRTKACRRRLPASAALPLPAAPDARRSSGAPRRRNGRDSASSEPTCRGYCLLNEDESLTEGYT
jgi:hypothetical protein